MIILHSVTKDVVTRFGLHRRVLDNVDLVLPTDRRIAVFSSVVHDLPVIIRLLSGLSLPTSGFVERAASVSFPIGAWGGFNLKLTARQNIEHVARMYGQNPSAVLEYVSEVADLNKEALSKTLGTLPGPRRWRLNCVLAYSLPFDVYLHASDLSRGPAKSMLGRKGQALLEARAKTSGIIIPCRSLPGARHLCDMGIIAHGGKLHVIDDLWTLKKIPRVDQEPSDEEEPETADEEYDLFR
jgi:capsular polysaccharide transport system ATP-binding protein